ncbi:MAG: hypothetical protein U0361_04610 [Nitrospiraceae bacterium]
MTTAYQDHDLEVSWRAVVSLDKPGTPRQSVGPKTPPSFHGPVPPPGPHQWWSRLAVVKYTNSMFRLNVVPVKVGQTAASVPKLFPTPQVQGGPPSRQRC